MFREHMPIIDRRVTTTLTRDTPSSHASIWDSQRPPPPLKKYGIIAQIRYTIAEICWLIRMGFVLLFNMGIIGKWCIMAVRLGLYAFFLTPAWCILGYTYFTSRYIKRGVRYGKFNRNFCDLYLPSNVLNKHHKNSSLHKIHTDSSSNTLVPVVVFVGGGAWTIGYKAWGALLGIGLQRYGVLLVSIDYRNYPQGKIGDMIDDCSNALNWTTTHIHKYGGDSNSIYLVGQSAGGHIAALTSMMKARRERERLLKDLEQIQHNIISPSRHTNASLHSIAETRIHNNTLNNNTSNDSHGSSNRPSPRKSRERANTTILDGSECIHQHINNTNGTNNVHTANSAVDMDVNQVMINHETNDDMYDYHQTINHAGHGIDHDHNQPILQDQLNKRVAAIIRRTSSAEPKPLIDASVVSPVKNRCYTYDQHSNSSVHRCSSVTNTPRKSRKLINLGTMHCSCCLPKIQQRSRSASLSGTPQTDDILYTHTNKRKLTITQAKWKLSQIRCLIGVSGVYNLVECESAMAHKGLPPYVLHSIMGSERGDHHELYTVDDGYHHTTAPLCAWSPTLLAHSEWFKSVVSLFPPVLLLHGTADTSSRWHASEQYGRSLAGAGCKVAVKYYDGATHTDPIIEGPMAGHDHLIYDILAVIHKCNQHYTNKLQKKYMKHQSSDYTQNHNHSNESDDESSDSDSDICIPAPAVDGYIPTSPNTSETVEPIPDFNLADEHEVKLLYNVQPAHPIIPKLLINCARYVNPF